MDKITTSTSSKPTKQVSLKQKGYWRKASGLLTTIGFGLAFTGLAPWWFLALPVIAIAFIPLSFQRNFDKTNREVSEAWFYGKWHLFGKKKFPIRSSGVITVREGGKKKKDGKKVPYQLIEYREEGKPAQTMLEYFEGMKLARKKAQELANYFSISFLDRSVADPIFDEQQVLQEGTEVF